MAERINDQNTDRLLTQREVEEWLGCSASFLEQARCRNPSLIAYIKVGKAVRYSRQAVQHYIDSQTVGAGI